MMDKDLPHVSAHHWPVTMATRQLLNKESDTSYTVQRISLTCDTRFDTNRDKLF